MELRTGMTLRRCCAVLLQRLGVIFANPLPDAIRVAQFELRIGVGWARRAFL